jgi:phosphoglycolate phosphatase-like HAD superfamily hydrolase
LVNEALPKDLRKRIFKDLANNAYKICAEEDCDLIITLAMKSKKNASKILFEAMCDNFPTFDLSEKFGTHKIISDHSYNESHLDRKIFVGARNKELENLLAYNFGQTKHIPIKFTPSAITINLDKEPPKTILLDVHGIFYDMEDIWSECLSYGLSKLHEQGVEYDHNFKFKHKPDIYKDINELFKDSSENAKKLVSMVREHYINMSQKELAINKDALELIHYLKHNKIDFLLVSNAPEKVISRDVYVIKHKYKKLFNKSIDIKYIADAGKPSIDKTIVAIGNKLSSDPTKHDFLLVGDKLNDLDFARNLGITGVLIGRKELQDSMRDGRTDFLFFEEIGDLKTYLSRIISTQKTSSTTPFKH